MEWSFISHLHNKFYIDRNTGIQHIYLKIIGGGTERGRGLLYPTFTPDLVVLGILRCAQFEHDLPLFSHFIIVMIFPNFDPLWDQEGVNPNIPFSHQIMFWQHVRSLENNRTLTPHFVSVLVIHYFDPLWLKQWMTGYQMEWTQFAHFRARSEYSSKYISNIEIFLKKVIISKESSLLESS